MGLNRNLPPVPTPNFAMVPRSDVPRSTFVTQHAHKTTFDAKYLVPIYVDEVLPGDVFKGKVTMFVRMATPLFPLMDNLHLESFFFFVPNRLVWDNWQKFMGEQANPDDSIDYLIPQTQSPGGGFLVGSLGDYFGLPVQGTQVISPNVIEVSALPFRAYNLIYNEWFRDQNVNDSVPVPKGDAVDPPTTFHLLVRNKRHDYFTSVLPWPQKGDGVTMPLNGVAPVIGIGTNVAPNASANVTVNVADGSQPTWAAAWDLTQQKFYVEPQPGTGAPYFPAIYADLSKATGATINAMRFAVATQQLLEKDARGGTRYTELLRMHFGVRPEDARLQRPEYIGGGHMSLQTQAIPQTSASDISGSTTPIGSLGGTTVGGDQHHFSYAATEHGIIIGLVNVRADLTYQQGVHKMWDRHTRYDFYWPVFANLGEQGVSLKELYATGTVDQWKIFGYQERWAEYRYRPSRITGLFRSNIPETLDAWHLSQYFNDEPAFNSIFLYENPPMARVLAAGSLAAHQQFLFDSVFHISCTRPIPARSVPGLARF